MNKVVIVFFVMTSIICDKYNGTTLTGNWKLIRYHSLTMGTQESEPSNIPRSIVIEFLDDGHTGKMKGHTVTNTVEGEYELSEGNKMKTLSFGGTKIGEPIWGHRFWNAIYSATSYERNTNKLFIFFNGGGEKMEFKKQ